MSDLGSPDITDLILDEHTEFRGQFVALWDLRPSGEAESIAAVWQPLADLLEVHASAEEDILYPVLLKRGGDEAPEETDDVSATTTRSARRSVAAGATSGSDTWWEAVLACRKANDDHLAEEERDVIPDFREHSNEELRSELGVRWVAFHADHRGARGVSGDDVGPAEYIEENSKAWTGSAPRRSIFSKRFGRRSTGWTRFSAGVSSTSRWLACASSPIPRCSGRVLGRLTGAAVAQTEPANSITVRVARTGKTARIEATNEGSPVAAGDLAEVTAEAEEFRVIGGEIGATGPVDTATYWMTVPLEPGTPSAAHA